MDGYSSRIRRAITHLSAANIAKNTQEGRRHAHALLDQAEEEIQACKAELVDATATERAASE